MVILELSERAYSFERECYTHKYYVDMNEGMVQQYLRSDYCDSISCPLGDLIDLTLYGER